MSEATDRTWPVKESGFVRTTHRFGREKLAEGDRCVERGDLDGAATAYVQALEHLRTASAKLQADAYARLGRANRLRRRATASVHCLRKALSFVEHHRPALEELLGLHAEWDEWDRVAELEPRWLELLEGEEYLRGLIRAGDRWWRQAGDPDRARERYRGALRLRPQHEQARARLRALDHARGREAELETLRRRAEASPEAGRRARDWLALGRAYWFELRRFDDAIDAFERAFGDDPTLTEAVELLTVALVERKKWERLESWWTRLADAKTPAEIAARSVVRRALAHIPKGASRRRRRRTLSWHDDD